MRPALVLSLALGLAAAGCGSGAHSQPRTHAAMRPKPASFRLALSAPTHTPRVGPKWWYVIRATATGGRPLSGRLTVEVVDPLGTAHPAQVGTSTRPLANYPFNGRYRDFAQWPAASRGYRLVFRVTVAAAGGRRSVRYWVRPR
ncbi:MAG TPA: hypothetical protein VF002_06525 [Gaiellaceae bacterium]